MKKGKEKKGENRKREGREHGVSEDNFASLFFSMPCAGGRAGVFSRKWNGRSHKKGKKGGEGVREGQRRGLFC